MGTRGTEQLLASNKHQVLNHKRQHVAITRGSMLQSQEAACHNHKRQHVTITRGSMSLVCINACTLGELWDLWDGHPP